MADKDLVELELRTYLNLRTYELNLSEIVVFLVSLFYLFFLIKQLINLKILKIDRKNSLGTGERSCWQRTLLKVSNASLHLSIAEFPASCAAVRRVRRDV